MKDALKKWRESIISAHARIRPMVRETPVQMVTNFTKCSVSVFFKLEHLQDTGSFKVRGATNKIALLTKEEAAAGIVTASNGNHGLAVAAAARSMGTRVEVFVSSQVSEAKLKLIQDYGALIYQVGGDPLEAEIAARNAANQSGKTFISPYNDRDVIAGQGTLGVELSVQVPQADAIFVAVGGGGLIGGIGAYLKCVSPQTEIVGCWPENSPVLYECIKAGHVVVVPEQPTVSESTAGGIEPASITVSLCKDVIDRSVLVSEGAILAAMRLIRDEANWQIEGAAAVAVAAFLQETERYVAKTIVIVLCGGNLSAEVARLI